MKKVLFLSLLLAGFVCMGCQNNGNPENDVNNNNVVEEIDIEEIGTDEDDNDNDNNNNDNNDNGKNNEMASALFESGKKDLEAGNINEAISQFNKALEIKDDADWIYGDLGRAQAENKDFDGAIESYTKAIDLNERSVYYAWRAEAYKAKGQEVLAEQDQKTADDLHSKGID